ncbi:PstS family phosphate ABC transporter substrate-binding protein [Aquirufa aurantiipilula]|uniref:Substrate-binding domain-containing protein n=1 Tax=Aquirufa aurantiipilula TaxID=2696561 RepID=A0ABT6BGJ0_9BACT|nr:substrate-binding domain-containing protein [Aquirufa aurantiipilula]MDF5689570.1 substrate-binding domain-containing protein [Aquirufa aurantiipilula]
MKIKYVGLSLLLLASIISCSKSKDSKFSDGPAQGEISVAVDESFQPLLLAEKSAFENNYHFAKINFDFHAENEAIADLLNEKVRAVVVTRDLTEKEKEIFTREKVTYRSYNFAADGLALLVHPQNVDTLLSLPSLKSLLTGKNTTWESLGAKSLRGEVALVVDKANSSNIKFLVDKFGLDINKPLPIFAAGSNKAVIEYVKTHKNALGLIGSNWISDGDNPTSLGFIRSVHVMSVSEKDSQSATDFYQPFGYNLALKKYPLRRDVKIILKESHMGLGTGFVNYVCGDMGQLVVLKAGLIPLTRPITIRQYQISQ